MVLDQDENLSDASSVAYAIVAQGIEAIFNYKKIPNFYTSIKEQY
ncbi:hypothetical protein NIES4075_11180 [Tolypothrix sp. NIES-4075]|nr:hypothetical protein NIES4075_11180 [Tolypothrix sp. NIES-4075]